MILVIKHIDIEGPGSMEEFFRNTARDFKIINLSNGDRLPEKFDDLEAIVSLGGPMNVYEEDKYKFLKYEDVFLKKAVKKEIPILGICLGAQLLAKAAGARVIKARQKEIGWYRAVLVKEGRKDLLFKGTDEALDVFQWHEDTFQIPDNAALLATSNTCRNQAFRLGRNAYGLQFHIEVTDKMIEDWAKKYTAEKKQMLAHYRKIRDRFKTQASNIYHNFAGMIRN